MKSIYNLFRNQFLKNRNIDSKEKLNNFLNKVEYPVSLFKDLKKIESRIITSINKKENIMIYGDYDVDGITSASLLYQFFKIYSYCEKDDINVIVDFPRRDKDAYGLEEKDIEKAKELDINLLITVDNGITANKAIDNANKYKIDVIIIDHHLVQEKIPNAFAILNPKQKSCRYPYKDFATVGLVYKLVIEMGKGLIEKDILETFKLRYKDIVAIGTYQDLAPLRSENRHFVKEGIDVLKKVIKDRKTNILGLSELLQIENKLYNEIDYNTIAFIIGPILNSAGRISTAKIAFDLLTTTKKKEAEKLALELHKLNNERREMIKIAVREAISLIDSKKLYENGIIIIKSKEWHEGIIGLIAQRISEKYKKTTIVMTCMHNNFYTASARAYNNVDIGSLIISLKEYLIRCGGHNQAAGFSIEFDKISEFLDKIYSNINKYQVEKVPLKIDAVLKLENLNYNLIKILSELEPFGEGNSKPIILIKNVRIAKIRMSKRSMDSLIRFCDDNNTLDIAIFNDISYIKNFKNEDVVDIILEVYLDCAKLRYNVIEIINLRK